MLEGCFIFMGEPIVNPVRTRLPISIVVAPQHVHNILHDTFVQKGCAIGVAVNVGDQNLFLVSASLDPYANFEDYENSIFDVKFVLSKKPVKSVIALGIDAQTAIGVPPDVDPNIIGKFSALPVGVLGEWKSPIFLGVYSGAGPRCCQHLYRPT